MEITSILKLKIGINENLWGLISKKFNHVSDFFRAAAQGRASVVELQDFAEQRTNNVPFRGTINFYWQNDFPSSDKEFAKLTETFLPDISKKLGVNLEEHLSLMLLNDRTYGSLQGTNYIVTSYYKLNHQRSEGDRESAMQEHLIMEQEESKYRTVHFNTVIQTFARKVEGVEFIFEGYCESRGDIDAIYAKPALQSMRKHSEAFLNTASRQLAFAKVLAREVL